MALPYYDANRMSFELGNTLKECVLFDPAHQEDYEDSLASSVQGKNKYLPKTTQVESTLLVFPEELLTKIFTLAVHEDFGTQYALHYTLSRSKCPILAKFAQTILFDFKSSISMLNEDRISQTALKTILAGVSAMPKNYRKYYQLLADTLAHGYVTLFNWEITSNPYMHVLIHQIIDGILGKKMITVNHEVKTRVETKAYRMAAQKNEELEEKKKKNQRFNLFQDVSDPLSSTRKEEAEIDLSTIPRFEEVSHLQPRKEAATFEVSFAKPPVIQGLLDSIATSPKGIILKKINRSAAYDGLVAAYLVSPFIGALIDTRDFENRLKDYMQSRPAWEWTDILESDQCTLLKNRQLKLCNVFNLYDTEWSEVMGDSMDGSIFRRTHDKIDARLVDTGVQFFHFMFRGTEFKHWVYKKLRKANYGKLFHDRFKIFALLAIEAGNVVLIQRLMDAGLFQFSQEAIEKLIVEFPRFSKMSCERHHTDYAATLRAASPEDGDGALFYTALINGVVQNKRYQSHTFHLSDAKSKEQSLYTNGDYLKHVKTIQSLFYALVEPYYYEPDDGSVFPTFWPPPSLKSWIASESPGGDSKGFRFHSIIRSMILNKQWDNIMWIAQHLLNIQYSPEAAKQCFETNRALTEGQLFFAATLLRALKDLATEHPIASYLEWVRNNIYIMIRQDISGMSAFYQNMGYDFSYPIAEADFALWVILSWFVQEDSIEPFVGNYDDGEEGLMDYKIEVKTFLDGYLSLGPDTFGIETFYYLVNQLNITQLVPWFDDQTVGYDGNSLHYNTDVDILADPNVQFSVEERIQGIALAMCYDMAQILRQPQTNPAPLTPWAMEYFKWNSLSILTTEQVLDLMTHNISRATDTTNGTFTLSPGLEGATQPFNSSMYRASFNAIRADYFNQLHSPKISWSLACLHTYSTLIKVKDIQMPHSIARLCGRDGNILDFVLKKLFSLDWPALYRPLIEAISIVPPNLLNSFHFNNKNLTDPIVTPPMSRFLPHAFILSEIIGHLSKYWDNLASNNIVIWNSILSAEAGPEFMRLVKATIQTKLPPNTSILASIHSLPMNVMAFYGSLDTTPRVNLIESLMTWSQTPQSEQAMVRQTLGRFFLRLHLNIQGKQLLDVYNCSVVRTTIEVNDLNLMKWIHTHYFSPIVNSIPAFLDYMDWDSVDMSGQGPMMPSLADAERHHRLQLFQVISKSKSFQPYQKLLEIALKSASYRMFEFLREVYLIPLNKREFSKMIAQVPIPYVPEPSDSEWIKRRHRLEVSGLSVWASVWLRQNNRRMARDIRVQLNLPENCGPVPLMEFPRGTSFKKEMAMYKQQLVKSLGEPAADEGRRISKRKRGQVMDAVALKDIINLGADNDEAEQPPQKRQRLIEIPSSPSSNSNPNSHSGFDDSDGDPWANFMEGVEATSNADD